MNNPQTLNTKLDSLVIFRSLLDDPVISKLRDLLSREDVPTYSAFAAELFARTICLTAYLTDLILSTEPLKNFPDGCLEHELEILRRVATLAAAEVREHIAYDGYLPAWETSPLDLAAAYAERVRNRSHFGFGIYARHHMFTLRDKKITPVLSPDETKLSDFTDYAALRQVVVANTRRLLNGGDAANILLYGDAGTGKSSTVKAVANEFKDEGLRLIEVPKKNILDLPLVAEELRDNPLKFILFIDDLSFFKENEEIGALKAMLEGSVTARTRNVVVYATSNRRHLVRETFSERDGDDIHRNETMQELISLSDRFGISVYFPKPDKDEYLRIVRALIEQCGGASVSDEELEIRAERFALERGGRSPRTAKQFALEFCFYNEFIK